MAPRTAICKQLALELSARRGFFLRSGFTPDGMPKKVIALNSASDVPQTIPVDSILIATIQLINVVREEGGSLYRPRPIAP